jgi:hypothetical protein
MVMVRRALFMVASCAHPDGHGAGFVTRLQGLAT